MSLEFVTVEYSKNADVLRKPCKKVEFPLSKEQLQLIEDIKQKVLDTQYCAGIAAPQVGASVQIIVFHVDHEARKFRDDVMEEFPLTALINATYTPVEEDGIVADWESCYSVMERTGKVKRYKTVDFEGYTPDGKLMKGRASGFLARLLQHEIDHTHGLLILDRLTSSCLQGTPEDMKIIQDREEKEAKKAKKAKGNEGKAAQGSREEKGKK